GTEEERGVHDVALTYNPSYVRRRPPDILWLLSEDPFTRAPYPDLIAAVDVYSQLGLGRRPGGRQREGGLVRFHPLVVRRLPLALSEKFSPSNIAPRLYPRSLVTLTPQNNSLFDESG